VDRLIPDANGCTFFVLQIFGQVVPSGKQQYLPGQDWMCRRRNLLSLIPNIMPLLHTSRYQLKAISRTIVVSTEFKQLIRNTRGLPISRVYSER
jgi:hypothetical protein